MARFTELFLVENDSSFEEIDVSVDNIRIFVCSDRPAARCFRGKSKKSRWAHLFPSRSDMFVFIDKAIKKQFTINKQKIDNRQKLIKESIANRNDVKVGDVFYTMWGYEQTNIDFFEVVDKPSKARVVVRQLTRTLKDTGFMTGDVSPIRGQYASGPEKRNIHRDGSIVNIDGRGYKGSKIDPNRTYSCSWYA